MIMFRQFQDKSLTVKLSWRVDPKISMTSRFHRMCFSTIKPRSVLQFFFCDINAICAQLKKISSLASSD